MRRAISGGVAALVILTSAVVVHAPHAVAGVTTEQTITLVTGGSGAPGDNDPFVTASLDGTTFVPAKITTPHPFYSTLPGTQWITVDGGAETTTRYRFPFTLPDGATAPSIAVDVHADNVGEVVLNGTSLGRQPSPGTLDNFQDPAEQFSTVNGELFVTGENHLDILVTDDAAPTGLDARATVHYTPAGGGETTPPTISIADVDVEEGSSGSPVAQLTLTIDPPSPDATSITASTVAGTAMAPAGRAPGDFTPLVNSVVSFDNNQATATISVPIVPDTVLERDETFSVVLTNPTGGLTVGDGTAVVTIRDDDPLTLSLGDASATEGNDVVLPITFSSRALDSGSVLATTFSGSAGSADYAGEVGRLIAWEAGANSARVRIATADDTVFEGDETFGVSLSDATDAVIGDGTGTGTILDNDAAPTPPKFSISGGSVMEDAGPLAFTVSIDNVQPVPVSVIAHTDRGWGSASYGADYGDVGGRFTIEAGQLSRTVAVPVSNDPFYENNETFRMQLASPSAGTIAQGNGYGTIKNDDPMPVLSIGDTSAPEGGPTSENVLDFPVALAQAVDADVQVDVSVSQPNAAPFDSHIAAVLSPSTLTIPAGEVASHVRVQIKGNNRDDIGIVIKATLSNPRLAGRSFGHISRATASGFVNDDDPPTPRVGIGRPATVTEGDPGDSRVLDYLITLQDVQRYDVTVDVNRTGGTVSTNDYGPLPPSPVTIPAGQRAAHFLVPVKGDVVDEPSETLQLTISNVRLVGVGSGQVVSGPAEGTINDDDPTAPRWVVANASVVEGDPGTGGVLRFPISFPDVQKQDVSIGYQATAGSAQAGDFQTVTGRVTVAAGARQAVVEVPVTGDLDVESDETVKLSLFSPSYGSINRSPGIGTIKDDDSFPRVSIDDGSGLEGTESDGSASFVVRLDHVSAEAVEVDFATRLNGKIAGAASGSDLTTVAGTVTFAPGETERVIVVALHADALVEVDETFTVQITAARGAKLGDTSAAGLIINDDSTTEG